jgi:hypothetical protein
MKTDVFGRPPESVAKSTDCGGGVNHAGIGHGTGKVCHSWIDAWQTLPVAHDSDANL